MFKTVMLGLAASTALAGSEVRAATLADIYSSFSVLGDSLSDNGNLFAATGGTIPQSPPYFDGRFSNGPVWNEGILEDFALAGKPAANFAFGGARVIANPEPDDDVDDSDPGTDRAPDLPEQAAALLLLGGQALAAGANDLVSLWGGANDVFGAIGQADAVQRVESAADGLVELAEALGLFGAETVMLFTLPELGETPRYKTFQPQFQAEATLLSTAFNDRLRLGSGAVSQAMVELVEIDSLFDDFLGTTGLETALPCLLPSDEVATGLGRPLLCSDPENYAYFDAVHPTAQVHDLIASEVRGTLAPIPLPAGAPLLLLGLAAFGIIRRRA